MQVLVDAPVWLDYFAGVHTKETDLLDRLLGRSAIAVADLSLAEVLYAMREERHRRAAEVALRKLWQVDLGGFDLAVKSAIHYNSLLAKGVRRPRRGLSPRDLLPGARHGAAHRPVDRGALREASRAAGAVGLTSTRGAAAQALALCR